MINIESNNFYSSQKSYSIIYMFLFFSLINFEINDDFIYFFTIAFFVLALYFSGKLFTSSYKGELIKRE